MQSKEALLDNVPFCRGTTLQRVIHAVPLRDIDTAAFITPPLAKATPALVPIAIGPASTDLSVQAAVH